MATSRATIKAIVFSVIPSALCSLTLLFYLWSKYESTGDCADIVHFQHLSIKSIVIMAFICIFWYGLSLILLKKTKKVFLITEGVIYVLLLLAFSMGGNSILKSRKIDWPTEYHPQPTSSKDNIHISKSKIKICAGKMKFILKE
ncbi:MAG: hypothetical protein K2M13_08475 [Muribaculaceae bacterium]|nr:hypothetical protein [Muribaculaceae bacterium]